MDAVPEGSYIPEYVERKLPSNFTGPEKYWEAAEEWYGIRLSPEQREICETVAENEYTLIEGANSFGKTYAIVALTLAFHRRHYPSSVVITSGSFAKLKRTFCSDAEDLHKQSPFNRDTEWWPKGEWKWSPNPHLDIQDDPTWQFEIHSPSDPEELEGVHNTYTLAIVDEADKDGVDHELIDAMESLVSDERDRMVVIANPPKTETNIVYELRDVYDSHLTYSSFDSHNVQVQAQQRDARPIPGLATIAKIKRDWEKYNGRDWPGLEEARTAHEEENHGLDERWLRRRAGVMPTEDATRHRPVYASDVRQAFDRGPVDNTGIPIAVGIDLARKGGDETVFNVLYPQTVRITAWSHTDHPENRRRCQSLLNNLVDTNEVSIRTLDIAVDAQGEGSGVADDLQDSHGAIRFKNSEKAVVSEDWDNKWTEALHHLGQRIEDMYLDDGQICDTPRLLREDLFAVARHCAYEERSLKSGDVLRASPKEDLKAELGRSPDRLDAFAMAAWAAADETGEQTKSVTRRRTGRDKRGHRRVTRR